MPVILWSEPCAVRYMAAVLIGVFVNHGLCCRHEAAWLYVVGLARAVGGDNWFLLSRWLGQVPLVKLHCGLALRESSGIYLPLFTSGAGLSLQAAGPGRNRVHLD